MDEVLSHIELMEKVAVGQSSIFFQKTKAPRDSLLVLLFLYTQNTL